MTADAAPGRKTTPSPRDVARWDGDEDWPSCSHCTALARWSLASIEDGDANNPTTSAFACRRHLSHVAEYHPDVMAGMDQAVLIDLYESGRS